MAVIYRSVGGKKLEKYLALLPEVQAELQSQAEIIGKRAEANLAQHHAEGKAKILLLRGDVDHYVVLDDQGSDFGAMSIEFGRAGFIDPDTGLIYGQMEPLYILSNAANLSKSRRSRKPKVRRLSPSARKRILSRINKAKKKRG